MAIKKNELYGNKNGIALQRVADEIHDHPLGICNTKTGKIWLNLQLAKKPPECLEYVILHELTHLKIRNHGEDFVTFMDEHMPYWREIRKKLNDSTLDYME